jgi:hypothetical protein
MPPTWSRGSEWLRWDPHLHAPGTLLNDQYRDDWPAFFEAVAAADPAAVALGITDYFSVAGYKAFVARRASGDLPSVKLVFPNIEMRLTTETRHGQGINLHLLVAPDDPRHVERIEGRLAQLAFRYNRTPYHLSDSSLRDLGRAYRNDPSLPDDAALSTGAGQFKVNFSDLVALFHADRWLSENVLIAIAAGNDGLGGVSRDSQFAAVREEMGRQAHIIFSSSDTERQFWLGRHPDFADRGLVERPCLHGSDAHRLEDVLNPGLERRCWIRGDATFESLKQTVLEPERRVFIGSEPPRTATEGYVIRSLGLANAPWVTNGEVTLNEGLVTVIGAKGSGKTAMADLVALVAGADEPNPGHASFIRKARPLISGLRGELTWGDGSRQQATVESQPQPTAEPRVQYLSQQFVERLSAPEELGEPLVEEIERVVFSAIPEHERLRASTFAELRDMLLEGSHADREFHRQSIRDHTQKVSRELRLERSVPDFKKKVEETERARQALEKEIAAIPIATGDEKVNAHAGAASALQALQAAIATTERRAKDLRDLAGEVRRQLQSAEQSWEQLKTEHPGLLDYTDWARIKPRIESDAFPRLAQLENDAHTHAAGLRERGTPIVGQRQAGEMIQMGLADLLAHVKTLADALGLDRTNAVRKSQLETRLTTLKANEESARRELSNAEGATARKKEAQDRRLESYDAVFNTLREEEKQLDGLYQPLRTRLAETRAKLSFDVRRVVDIDAWVKRGEGLLDLRRTPFSGQDYLAREARTHLLDVWTRGTSEGVRLAMRAFLDKNGGPALQSLLQGVTPSDLGEWLFSTDHIRVRYGIAYEGVPIATLSPGTRGVVLLTLYLALDEWDFRPLVIDQPEENLDPSSVYSDLVPFFRTAAHRRQIIMVTHNANLVVNTDSDQVIVATALRERTDQLPNVTYSAGGLEDPSIRQAVCDLLEGGEDAFRKRGRRYGVGTRP